MEGKALPEGQVTILFSDIEASTAQWEAEPQRMQSAIILHDKLSRKALGSNGRLIKRTGDGFNYVYQNPADAAKAAIELQDKLLSASWPQDKQLQVRVGFHTGVAQPLHGDYYGPTPNRAARVADIAHGGQIVCSAVAAALLNDELIDFAGNYDLRGIGGFDIYFVGVDAVTENRDLSTRIRHTNIRAPVDTTIGRTAERQQLVEWLDQGALVTIQGLGGVGKSRLAIEAGLHCLPQYTDGVWLCELASTSSADAVPDLIAKALGAKRQPSMSVADSIIDFLRNKRLLLILDNCEHLKPAVVDMVQQIATLSDVSILATSREPLAVADEVVLNLVPLEMEDSGALFRSRMASGITEAASDTDIQEICRAVDGVPLALELAAAWLSVYSADEIHQRLQEESAKFLKERGGRQRVVLDTLAWSYNLLPQTAATLFTRLCVFSGGFTLKSLMTICDGGVVERDDIPDLLVLLCEKSLVLSVRQSDGSRRFRVLEVLKEFGRQKLGEQEEYSQYRQRHAQYFCKFAADQDSKLSGTSEVNAWCAIDDDWANLRTAFKALCEVDTETAAAMVISLGWYAVYSVRVELFDWAHELLQQKDSSQNPQYADLCGLAALGCYVTVHPDAMLWAEKGIAASASSPSLYCRTALIGVLVNNQLDSDRAETATREWLEQVQQTTNPNPQEWLWAHGFRVFHLCTQQQLTDAMPLSAKILEHARWSGSASATAVACWAHGMTQLVEGLDSANAVWDDGVGWAQTLSGGHLLTHLIVGIQLHMSVGRGDLPVVLKRCHAAILAARKQHYQAGTSHLFGVTAVVLSRVGDPETAARLLGAMVASGHQPRQNALGYVRKQLGDSTEARMSAGAMLSISDAADIALQHLQKHIDATP